MRTYINNIEPNKEVCLKGWVDRRRDHGGLCFIDLRDKTGLCQVVIDPKLLTEDIKNEYVLEILGDVKNRPNENINADIPKGDLEVIAKNIKVLNISKALPFQISNSLNTKTDLDKTSLDITLKYRYLELRKKKYLDILTLRSNIIKAARLELYKNGFLEIETPYLTASTPEGARDFIVPSRLNPGSWYALAQSPQLFKELLMVAGVERYFQVARCFRDEDFRADRQPEFTQLDIEMSFAGAGDIMLLSEEIIRAIWAAKGIKIDKIERISYKDAMDLYGSDKPDLRYDICLREVTDIFKNSNFRLFQNDYVGCVVYKGGACLKRKDFDRWQEWAKQNGAPGLAYIVLEEEGIKGPIAKFLQEDETSALLSFIGAKTGDAIFFAAGKRLFSQELLGAARQKIARDAGLIDENVYKFAWIYDFPMFLKAEESDEINEYGAKYLSCHHPFTAPKKECQDSFLQNPDNALSAAYDLVCNGHEIAGGSERIYSAKTQKETLKFLGLGEDEIDKRFGFLLEALSFGAPPMAGIAFGLDRITAILSGSASIRDVIAFPKSKGGSCLLTGAPNKISQKQRKESGVDAEDI